MGVGSLFTFPCEPWKEEGQSLPERAERMGVWAL